MKIALGIIAMRIKEMFDSLCRTIKHSMGKKVIVKLLVHIESGSR